MNRLVDKLIIISLAVVHFFGLPGEVRADGWIRHEFRPALSDEVVRGVIELPRGGEPLVVRDGHSIDGSEAPPRGKIHRSSPAPRHRPDRETDFMGELNYFEAYQPSVAPHKRLEALDGVELSAGGVPELILVSRARERVPIDDQPPSQEGERFIGEVWVDLSSASSGASVVSVPIPSVSPQMRILHLTSTPSLPLSVERDGAGNYYLSSPQKIAEPVRVLLFVEANANYFNRAIPDLPIASLSLEVQRLPRGLEAEALAFAAELGLSRESSLKAALEVLVEYFRAFIEGETQLDFGESIYSELARGGYGICRHRAYAFMITALALGIPTRYVQNEAHAFVEVDLPANARADGGALESMRIELGGSTAFVEGHGLSADRMHRPRHPDPFPQPEAYLEGMRQGSVPSESAADEPSNDLKPSRYRATIVRAELSGYRGDRVRVELSIRDQRAGGLAPAEPLTLTLRASDGSTLARGISDPEGHALFSLRIPYDLEPGTHKLELLARSGTDSPEERIPIDVK